MFNTAKNTIKKAAKDQVEFFLVLLTGVFTGSIFTLAYIKYWDTSKVTFADIGGMLAGVGTVGLLFVGLSWKRQISYQNNLKALSDWYIKALSFNRYMKDIMKSRLENHSHVKGEFDYTRERDMQLKAQIQNTQDIQAQVILIHDKNQNQIKMNEYRDKWYQHLKELTKTYYETEKQKHALEDAEAILLAIIIDDKKKKKILQLSKYISFDNTEIGTHDYEHQLQIRIDNKKGEINKFYNESLKQLH